MKVYQIELSNYCNLTCDYCPHVNQKRKKGLMSLETYKKTIELVKRLGQKQVFLHNFGEPLMHPQLDLFIQYAVRNGLEPDFFTNGVLLTKKRLLELYYSGLRNISISEHTEGMHQKIASMIKQIGLDIKITNVFYYHDNRHDWGGQVNETGYLHARNPNPCIFEMNDAFVVLWDGQINTCCISVEDQLDITVDDLLGGRRYSFNKIKLCQDCDLMRKNEVLV